MREQVKVLLVKLITKASKNAEGKIKANDVKYLMIDKKIPLMMREDHIMMREDHKIGSLKLFNCSSLSNFFCEFSLNTCHLL